jgi:hypothetical protein
VWHLKVLERGPLVLGHAVVRSTYSLEGNLSLGGSGAWVAASLEDDLDGGALISSRVALRSEVILLLNSSTSLRFGDLFALSIRGSRVSTKCSVR